MTPLEQLEVIDKSLQETGRVMPFDATARVITDLRRLVITVRDIYLDLATKPEKKERSQSIDTR